MPKVSVITLPAKVAEIEQQTAEKKPVPRRLSLANFFSKTAARLMPLVSRDNMLMSILAFLLGRVLIMGECAPAGLAFFTAVAQIQKKRTAVVGLFTVLGVLSRGHYWETGIYVFVMGAFFLYRDKLMGMQKRIAMVPLFMFFAILAAGLVINFFKEFTLYNILLVLFEAATCVMLSYVFLYAISLIENQQENFSSKILVNERLSCVVILLATAVAGLGNSMIFEYSVRNIAGSLLVAVVAYIGGAGLSAAVGIIVGLIVGLSDGNTAFAISLYGLAGVLAGTFRRLGKIVVIVGFLLGSVITALCLGHEGDIVKSLSECLIAGTLFFLVPNRWLLIWRQFAQQRDENINYTGQVRETIAKMNHIGEVFHDLAKVFDTITADTQNKIVDDKLAKTLSAVGEQICAECPKRSQCWELNFYQTYNGILEMLGQAEVNKLTMTYMPVIFRKNCIKCKEMLETVQLVAERNQMSTFWQKKIMDNRQMITEQMKAMHTIINNLTYEMGQAECLDEELAYTFQEKANILGCQLTGVRAVDKQGRSLIEAYKKPCNGNRECVNTILPLAAGSMKEKMTLHAECGNEKNGKNCKLIMEAAKRFSISTGIAAAAKDGQEICGDTCAVIELNRGKIAFILSDGMGSGCQAGGQSTLAISFLRKLMIAGFDTDVAIKTVNAMLLLCSSEESFVTIDIAVLDTYSGNIEFLKIGSAPSFIKRVREVATIQSASLPIGILETIEIKPVQSVAVSGDFIIMVSDGIVDVPQSRLDKGNWLANFLRQSVQSCPQQLANEILSQAKAMSGNRVCDDMTVLVGKISEKLYK